MSDLAQRLEDRAAGFAARGDTIFNGSIIAEELRRWSREAAAPPPKADTSGVEQMRQALEEAKIYIGDFGPRGQVDTRRRTDTMLAQIDAALTAAPAPQGGVTREQIEKIIEETIIYSADPRWAAMKPVSPVDYTVRTAPSWLSEDEWFLGRAKLAEAILAALSQSSPAREGWRTIESAQEKERRDDNWRGDPVPVSQASQDRVTK